MDVKVDIISGFLGAGKTTLIKKLLEETLQGEKLAIIENEFGEIGIDGSILKHSGIEVKEINSGCICCTLVGDFVKAIEEVITKYKPDRVIIEPSGVGKLSDVIKACDNPKLKDLLKINMVIAVVDALKYQLYISNFGEFFENQIKYAKTIILSRTQKADSEKLKSTVSSIRKLNNKANIVTTPWEVLKADQMIAIAEQNASAMLENQMPVTKVLLKKHHHGDNCNCDHQESSAHHHKDCGCSSGDKHNHKADEVFDVWGIETPKVFNEEYLRTLINQCGNEKTYGMVLRGKGIVQVGQNSWVQFDYVPGEVIIKAANPDYTGRICIIGSGLKKEELSKLFQV